MSFGSTAYGLGKLSFNSPTGGQTETYYFDTTNLTLIKDNMSVIARIRLRLLATNCTMVGAVAGTHSSVYGTRITRLNLLNTPLPASGQAVDLSALTTQPTDTNVSADAIQVVFNNDPTLGGPIRNSNRYLRMIPDLYIKGDGFYAGGFAAAVFPPSVWGGTPQRAVDAGFTAADYLNAWMEFVARNCCSKRVAHRAAPVPPATIGKPDQWDLIAYATAAVVRPCTRRVGRPIGPFRGRRRS